MNTKTDTRLQALVDWANEQLGQQLEWFSVSTDASFRRYFRAKVAGQSWIAVDAPPQSENNQAFIKVSKLALQAGLNVPEVLFYDLEQGFMVITDLGTQTYLQVLNDDNVDELFTAAIGALVDWQRASQPRVLPDYSREVLAHELALFTDWYVPKHLQLELSKAQHRAIDQAFSFLLDAIEKQAKVFVHRDYMPRNLMISQPMPGVIDFQDALYGPVTYDLASLFQDAFISWPQEDIRHWQRQYWQQAKTAGIPVAEDFTDFCKQVALMGAQRHLKVLGIFARIAYRDGKPKYLSDAPRFIDYLLPVVERYPELSGLKEILLTEPACA